MRGAHVHGGAVPAQGPALRPGLRSGAAGPAKRGDPGVVLQGRRDGGGGRAVVFPGRGGQGPGGDSAGVQASRGVGVPKPDGTPRPLGIGDTAARFVATLVLDRVKGAASRALLPYQFGMCVNGGAGYAYKIIQRKMERDGAAVSLEDEACAFNYMDQEVMCDFRAYWI